MDHVSAILDLLTTAIPARSALKVPSGAPQPTSASSSAVKTPPTLPLLEPAPATPDTVSTEVHANSAPTTTSSPTDTV
jgi:hypothetical protein